MVREFWMMAVWLVALHGARAPYITHAQIMALRRELADERTIATLLLVDNAVHEWARVMPATGETIH
jgi:alkylhydroperoxidase family enzyme